MLKWLSKKPEDTSGKERTPKKQKSEGSMSDSSTVKREKRLPGGIVLKVIHGDITEEKSDCIVNAANERLSHGGGVAGAISRKGGRAIQDESDEWVDEHGRVSTGQVAVTGPGRLKCKKVIHAVGPVWEDGNEDEPELLESAVKNSLLKAEELQLTSISLPAISSGIFGFPKDLCAEILFDVAIKFAASHTESSVREIRFCNFDAPTVRYFVSEFDRLFSQTEDEPSQTESSSQDATSDPSNSAASITTPVAGEVNENKTVESVVKAEDSDVVKANDSDAIKAEDSHAVKAGDTHAQSNVEDQPSSGLKKEISSKSVQKESEHKVDEQPASMDVLTEEPVKS
mmetsp:Transcript_38599/g.62535  ORF Transcript_38599/g.62535 Transcript_38599/m.62535 type:complete len:342 (-) Transcript_38599:358-1383(-)|eukprot:CAMPEP_0184660044 /NCGR_PEP_ID=MMETSP0308-20130426/32246_1 /TAXON_ID=38269 /ORGANISM="Gloeochaete witrockiana, Strain SAG 46.84" /LENGTH=341 /DNA_ID=CAMNT_0027100359 /DNA_START=29 /DNA_END=1054 /DNA_ORIENTATION=-